MQPTPVPQPRLRPWVVPVGISLVVSLVVVVALLPWMLRHLSWPTVMSESADSTPATPAVLSSDYAEPGATYGARPAKPVSEERPAVVQAGLVAPSTNGAHPPPLALLPKPAPGQAAIPTAVLQQTPAAPVAMQPPSQTPRALVPQQTPQTPAGTSKPPGHWGIELTHAQQRGERRPPTRKEVEDMSRYEAARSLITPAVIARPKYPTLTIYKSQVLPGRLINSLSSDVPGIAQIELTIPLFDKFGQGQILLDKGTIIIAKQTERPEYGQTRLPITIDQLELVNGEVLKVKAVGEDAEGKTGLTGRVNNHYGKLALSVGINALLSLGVNSAAGTPSGFYASPTQQAARDATQSASQDIRTITEKQLKVPPTIEIAAGTLCQIQLDENIQLNRLPYVAK